MLAFMEYLCVRQLQKHHGEIGTFLLVQTTKERMAGKRLLVVLGPTPLQQKSSNRAWLVDFLIVLMCTSSGLGRNTVLVKFLK